MNSAITLILAWAIQGDAWAQEVSLRMDGALGSIALDNALGLDRGTLWLEYGSATGDWTTAREKFIEELWGSE